MDSLKTTIIAGAVLVGSLLVPIIPEEMQLSHSYQYDASSIRSHTEISATSTVTTEFPDASFTDVDGNGKISVSVFADHKGNSVYVQIPDTQYKDMGKKEGQLSNPTEEEKLSLFEEFLAPKEVEAAIAFDQATNPALANASSLTYEATTTGSTRLLYIGVMMRGMVISGVTFNSASTTEIGTRVLISGGDYLAHYFLIAPDTGAHNVVISGSASDIIISGAASYTGIDQASQPDANNNQAVTTSADLTTPITTVADNSWIMLTSRANGDGNTDAGTSTTQRADTAGYIQLMDRGADITPEGPESINTTQASQPVVHLVASFDPAVCDPATEICSGEQTVTTAGFTVWTAPTNVSSANVACWGAGGGGDDGTNTGGGGGGGGAFASSSVSVTAGNTYDIFIGTGGSESVAGTDSTFSTTTVVAEGGQTTTSTTGGLGGRIANSTGDVKLDGGAGGVGETTDDTGGGGGGAGGPHATGTVGTNGNGTIGGAGGQGDGTDGGAGGAGGNGGDGTVGTADANGGGGGGGGDNGAGGGNGGAPGAGGGGADVCDNGTQCVGADGQCYLSWSSVVPAAGGRRIIMVN